MIHITLANDPAKMIELLPPVVRQLGKKALPIISALPGDTEKFKKLLMGFKPVGKAYTATVNSGFNSSQYDHDRLPEWSAARPKFSSSKHSTDYYVEAAEKGFNADSSTTLSSLPKKTEVFMFTTSPLKMSKSL